MDPKLYSLLIDCRTALGDWVSTYASEFCRDENVKAAYDRISDGGGTLAYIGHLVSRINDAISPVSASEESK